ncbi:unnamed protein product [Closterium sp. NIES-54]
MGHVALPILQQLVKNEMVASIHVKGEPDEATAKAPLDEVVMDVVGPLKLGAAGAEYFLTIVDVYTRMTWVYVLSKKNDVAETVKTDWLPMVERQQDRLVKAIRTDRGGEFLSKEFSLWLKKNGIRHSLTMPYSPAMNGIAERANRTITETARGLLIEAGLPEYFWPDAVRTSVRGTASAPRIRVTPQQRQGLHVPADEEEGRGKRRIQAPNRLTYDALGRPAKSALAGAALIAGDDKEIDYDECAFVFFSPVEMPGEPATLKEALESSDAEEWKKAIDSELKSIEENGTWELVELPEGRKAITSKWLFKIKSDADGKIERYKSRLVAKGYQQKEKVDYKELFSPVVKPTTLRTLLTEGFDDGSGRVLRLKKSLYKLKQAPRQWYLKLRGVLEEIGFTPSTADHSLFMLGEGEQRSFMVVYVDDILIFSPSSDLVKEVMLKLKDKFKCKALGDVNFYLGIHIERDVEKRCMRVHQRKYLEALAANFRQSEGHVATPFPSGFKCVKRPEEKSIGEEERRRFHSLVGSLMYAAVNTRPDVAFATGQLARVVLCPNEEQVAAGMRVAKYLGQTPTIGLQYSAAAQRRQKGADGVELGRLFLTAFSDDSYASEPEDMRSVGGFICCVGGGPTAWESKKQVDQALSSVESEYMALFQPLGAVSTMARPEERGGRGAGGSEEAQAQGHPCDSAMAPMQPILGPPRDEPRVFGLDKFNGDNFAEWSFKMENIFDHYDLLEVMEGTEKRPENDPKKIPWVRKSAQGYLQLGQALGSSQIRHIKPFQREPEKGPKAWAAHKGVHGPATAAVAVVLERQMAALRIEEDKAVEEGVQKFFDLPRLLLEDVKRAILQEDFRRRELASADGAGAASIGRGGASGGRRRGRGGRGCRGGGAASMKGAGNESESRDDRFPGQFFFVSMQAPAGPEKDEGFEEPAAVGKVTLHSLDYWVIDSGATYSMTPRADLLTELEPSLVKHVTSPLGQRAEVKGMGKAMFKGADGKMVGLKNVLWVPNLAANLISVRRLQKAGMDTSSKGATTYTARLGEQILWDLHEDSDVYNEMWQIHVVPMPKERQVAASIITKGEAVGSGDGANGRAKEIESKKCNLGVTSQLGEHKESGAAVQKQHKGEENPKAAADEEYGDNMWGTIASAAFSNPTSATGECDWLTLHRRMGHVAVPILQQLVKNEMVAGIRVKGELDEVLGCPTCMQAKFTRYPFSSSEATAKAPLDEVVMDVVGPPEAWS